MEPCAPGTEDDPPIMYSTLNKQATEQERLLKQKAILKNGQYDNIFELSYVNGAEHWFCNACQCPVMGRVYQHEIGKRHTQNLAMNNRHLDKPRRDEPDDDPITIDVAPGEPVPPGFEEEIGRVAQIQERLDGFKVGPLIALEYLLELQDYDPSKEPVYLCILCDKRGDPRTVLTHLASYNHISQYLQKHFPTCYRALAPYMTKQYKRNWQITLQKIAEAIEKKFGRLKPYPIEKDKFEKERMHYLQQISKGKHFSEQSGWTFEELIVHDELTKSHGERPFKKRSPSPPVVACPTKKNKTGLANKKQLPAYIPVGQSNAKTSAQPGRRRSLSSVSSISSSDMSEGEGRVRKAGRSPRRRESPSPRGRQLPYQRRRSPSPRRKSPPKRKGEMPWQNPNYQKQKNEFTEKKMTEKERDKIRKIEEFRKLARAIENDMHKTLKQHEKNPEKHPQYNEEWKKFWNKRYKELQTQGVDASKHDFKPEWIEYWNKRMVELHSDELRNRKDALRKRLGLPEEINPIKFKIGVVPPVIKENPKENKPNLPMAAQPDQDNEVIIIDDKDDDSKSRSPWEKDTTTKPKPRVRRSPSPRSRKRSPRRSRSRDRNPPRQRSKSREKHQFKRSRSKERYFSTRSKSRDRSRSREIMKVKDYSPMKESSRTKDNRSPSREMSRSMDHKDSREKRSHSLDRKSRSRDKSREKRDMDYRESSYERDMRGRERVRTVADLPWEREKAVYRSHFEDYYKPPSVMREATRKPVILPDVPGMQVVMPEDDDDGEVNIVDVLRILTALEERLGSLGPKIIDLLAQALALEKKEANSSEMLLDSDLNCVLFETVKEKLKGQLLAGLVDMVQERAFKKAIKKTATLIHMAGQRKRQRERMMPKVNPVIVPGVGTVDKAAIAKQIATALIMQGKTDVTQAELEYLINAVVGMAEASKNSNKPMTTATFLQQIAGGSTPLLSLSKQHEAVEPDEKIIIPSNSKKSNVVELEKLTEPLTPSPGKSSVSNMENLSDLDLQTLLQNFKDLSTDEQHNLINYLKKLETHEPERVERLRKFVNLDPNARPKEEGETVPENKTKSSEGRQSPFSNRHGSVNPASDDLVRIESDEEDMGDEKEEIRSEEKEKPPTKVHLDSEDEDYTYEDVVKAVSKNVKDKELENNMKIVEETMKFETNKAKNEVDLTDAKALISNLMSNFSKGNSNTNSIDLLGLGISTPNPPPLATTTSNIMTSTADFAKTLSSINVANLASIVNNVKMMSQEESKERPLNFEPPSPLRSNTAKLNFDPTHLNRGPSPRVLDRTDLPMGYDDVRRNIGLGRQGAGYDLGVPGRGPGGPGSLLGPGGNLRLPSYGGPGGLSRDSRGSIIPPRDLGVSGSLLGSRDRPLMQYPRSTGSFGPSFGNNSNNDFPPLERVQYSGRPNVFDQRGRMDNPRFGGNLFNNRPSSGNYRW
ncbi:uncharacterized protein CG7065 isoform X2 [Anoplophora glabripennis]|uniref:uncharacterized protein CG7065 isoform X2 n=1 Tax=Anoplophora glabripennis TaxID=217634 RepID=UPI000873FB40|nr:uncharacterized protein CG7065 isoform X2 [Anoplophora glabripennis]